MTPLEQEVYALMGISPLVYANKQGKESKSVIVAVRTPGEPESANEGSVSTMEKPVLEVTASASETEEDSNSNALDKDNPDNQELENERPLVRRRRRRSSAREA
jgi:ribonuclease E